MTLAEIGERLDGFTAVVRAARGPRRVGAAGPRAAHLGAPRPRPGRPRERRGRVLDYVIAQDVGRALNPALIEGQLHGGATQGLGWALHEAMVHDEAGQLLTGTFLDYALPTATDVPRFETILVEVPAPDGPYGAKGVGEGPICGAAAAVANAVAAATGVRYRSLPMTAPRIWRGLVAARPDRTGAALVRRAPCHERDPVDPRVVRVVRRLVSFVHDIVWTKPEPLWKTVASRPSR